MCIANGLIFQVRVRFYLRVRVKTKIAKFVCIGLCLRSFVFVCGLVGHDVGRTWRIVAIERRAQVDKGHVAQDGKLVGGSARGASCHLPV